MKVDLVIPTYNRAKLLRDTLFRIPLELFDKVYIVDDGSDDVNVEELNRLCAEYKITVVKNIENKGAGARREQGFYLSKNDFVLFSDDDIVFDESFFYSLLRCQSVNGSVVTGGITLPEDYTGKAMYYIKYSDLFCKIRVKEDSDAGEWEGYVPFVWNPMLICKSFYIENSIEFYPYRGNGYREETDHQLQALEKGAIISYSPDALAYHVGRQNEGGAWKSGNAYWRKLNWYRWSVYNDYIFFERQAKLLNSRCSVKKPTLIRVALSAIRNLTVFKK